ncbi:MAG: hypothetical protein ACREJ0_02250 [Geminicoccaceae bacterium]
MKIQLMTQVDSEDLQAKFDAFQALHPRHDSDTRKSRVRELEREVKAGRLIPSSQQVQEYAASHNELARIFVYLLIENGKINSDSTLWRRNILSEWELLKRASLRHDRSRMPLYYAVRSYIERLRSSSDLSPSAIEDRYLVREIEKTLEKSEIDRDSQVRSRVAELLSLLEGKRPASDDTAIGVARISRRGMVVSAVIAAAAMVLTAILANWDKISGSASTPKK